ncbi:TPA: alanine racemase [Pseudomonas aeruginosa]|nr:alanine racemase [Pseudomonas aeruginosa]
MNVMDLPSQMNTPAFVYCHDTLDQSRQSVQGALNRLWEGNWIAYSYKTNPLLARHLARMGCAMQVTSPQHLREVMRFLDEDGLSRSFYCSGSLTPQDAQEVVASGLYIVVDSLSQLECIEQASMQSGRRPRILIRVDAGQSAADSPFGTSGMLQGIDIRKLPELLEEAREHVQIVGIHNHFGSQVTSLEAWKHNIECISLVLRDLDHSLQILNLGGGTPISYDDVDAPTIETIYENCLNSSIRAVREKHPEVRIVLEPGRYLVGPCGFLVTTATNLHFSDNRLGANLDASLFASFQDRFLSGLTFQLPIVEPPRAASASQETILRGSSPASIDYFGIYPHLPEIALGDRVVFGMAGAYASSMGSGFSGVTRPAEYLLQDGKLEELLHDF